MKFRLTAILLSVSCYLTLSCTSTTDIKQDPQNELSYEDITIANNYAKDGLFREAVNAYKKILNNNPEHHTARRNLGLVFIQIGEYKQAAALLEKSVQMFPKDFETNFYLGESYRGIRRYADAIFWYKNALLIKNDDQKTLRALSWSYFTIKFYSEALKTARILQKINPLDVQNTIVISKTFLKLNRSKEALKILKTAKNNIKTSDPYYANLLSVEGEIHFALGNETIATQLFKDAIKIQPLLSSALIGLGRCATNNKDFNEAVDYLERAIRIKPKDAAAYLYLAQAYEQIDANKSIKYYQEFNKRGATDPEYISLMQDVKLKLNQLKKSNN